MITRHKIKDDDGFAYCWDDSDEIRVDLFPPNDEYDRTEQLGFIGSVPGVLYDPSDIRNLAKILLEVADELEDLRIGYINYKNRKEDNKNGTI